MATAPKSTSRHGSYTTKNGHLHLKVANAASKVRSGGKKAVNFGKTKKPRFGA